MRARSGSANTLAATRQSSSVCSARVTTIRAGSAPAADSLADSPAWIDPLNGLLVLVLLLLGY
jgi:hypothetical protein